MYKNKINSSNFTIEEFAKLPRDENCVVTWYGGLKKNSRAKSAPNIVVFLRIVNPDGSLGTHIQKTLSLTNLGQIQLGSIWQNGKLQGCCTYDSMVFDVDFNPEHWSFVSPGKNYPINSQISINPDDYELRYKNDQNWLVSFPLKDYSESKNLLIPCMEFFFRCYGASAETKRVLATYSWQEVEERLYDKSYSGGSERGWHVKLRYRMHKNDVVLLAHLKYDLYSRLIAKSVYSQIADQLRINQIAFPQIGPWFKGKARLKVEGLWINGGQTFLGLRVIGCTDPEGESIIRTKEKRPKINKDNITEVLDGAEVTSFPIQSLNREDIVDVTTGEEPDNPSDWISVLGSEFQTLGEPRTVIDRRSEASGGGRCLRFVPVPDGEEISKVSGGEPYGSGKGVASELVFQARLLDSQGVLRDMWNALHFLKEQSPDVIKSVSSYSFSGGFNFSGEPECMALSPVTAEEEERHEFASGARKWVYMDDQRTRGILVMCVHVLVEIGGIIQIMPVYIVEIERRLRKVKRNEEKVDAEETFKGLIFTLSDHSQLDETLRQFMFNIRRVKGVVHKVARSIPGDADTFKHTQSLGDRIAYERTVRLALGKIGVRV